MSENTQGSACTEFEFQAARDAGLPVLKITSSQITKHVISGVPNLDPITLILEDFGPGQGKVTITSFEGSWSHYWSHMGDKNKVAGFFCGCSDDYLVRKLSSGIRHEIDCDEPDALEALLKKEIIDARRQDDITHEQARDFYNRAGSFDRNHDGTDLLYEVLGDECWYRTPQQPNPEYEHLCEIVQAVKQAITSMEQHPAESRKEK